MTKSLLIVFVKSKILGKVKTRLAKNIGDEKAFEVYGQLVSITEKATKGVFVKKQIYYSEVINDDKWPKTIKKLQKGGSLGQKMQNSFKNGFNDGFEKIILIGSDLPDISAKIINKGFSQLANNEVVFGPALDGGYYLIGMTKEHFCIFQNKQWSAENLLEETLNELNEKNIPFSLLETLNDIDTVEDLRNSELNRQFEF